jgi:hypothetical protein
MGLFLGCFWNILNLVKWYIFGVLFLVEKLKPEFGQVLLFFWLKR